jgi:hypothetical protein
MDFPFNGYTIRVTMIRADSGTACRGSWAVHHGQPDTTEAIHADVTGWFPSRGPAEAEARAQAVCWAGDLPHAGTLVE